MPRKSPKIDTAAAAVTYRCVSPAGRCASQQARHVARQAARTPSPCSANVVMASIVMVYVVTAYVVMAYAVMAYAVMTHCSSSCAYAFTVQCMCACTHAREECACPCPTPAGSLRTARTRIDSYAYDRTHTSTAIEGLNLRGPYWQCGVHRCEALVEHVHVYTHMCLLLASAPAFFLSAW